MLDDSSLSDEVDAVAAAVGLRTVRVSGPAALTRAGWSAALAVVLDTETARRFRDPLPRRSDVYVVTGTEPGDEDFRAAMAIGAQAVLQLPGAAGELVAALSSGAHAAVRADAASGEVVAVVGGRGGAGASVFAAALALRAPALLVDLDPCGGGLDLLLGTEAATGLRWPDLAVKSGRVSWDALRQALPSAGAVAVLSGARRGGDPDPGAAEAVIDAGRRGGAAVVCDLPRHLSDAAVVALGSADLVVVVCPADIRSCAATAALAPAVAAINPNVGLVVRGPAPGGLRATDVAAIAELPLLASMRPEPLLAERLERGGLTLKPRSPLASAANRVWDVLPGRRRAAVAA
ncbi:septum site-determining protein Ssd [Mycobacterium sp. ACS4331]|uniref:septum site-determining protein Ssd n=1 Tax=Mycobacterium sp. ACS4331 TaxID=1834121 RepID=UPI0007FE911F|nr:hypothetical protein A5727_06860 [Mycobacterium sp. ACS4331]